MIFLGRKSTKMHYFTRNASKCFWGVGTDPSSNSNSTGEGGIPPQTSPPRRLWRLDSAPWRGLYAFGVEVSASSVPRCRPPLLFPYFDYFCAFVVSQVTFSHTFEITDPGLSIHFATFMALQLSYPPKYCTALHKTQESCLRMRKNRACCEWNPKYATAALFEDVDFIFTAWKFGHLSAWKFGGKYLWKVRSKRTYIAASKEYSEPLVACQAATPSVPYLWPRWTSSCRRQAQSNVVKYRKWYLSIKLTHRKWRILQSRLAKRRGP